MAFHIMCSKIILIVIIINCYFSNFGYCRPRQYHSTASTTTIKPNYRTIPSSVSSTVAPFSVSNKDGKPYQVIIAPQNCSPDKGLTHAQECVEEFYSVFPQNTNDKKQSNTNQGRTSTVNSYNIGHSSSHSTAIRKH